MAKTLTTLNNNSLSMPLQKLTALKKQRNGSLMLLISVAVVALFGVLMIYSASRYTAKADYNNEYYFVVKQLIGFALGLVAMIFCYLFDYKILMRGSLWYYLVSVVLLALVFISLFSVEVYGAKRWIKVAFFTIQPSEIAKFAYIIFVASYFAKNPDRAISLKGISIPLLSGMVLCLLIILEPNMSITICFACLMLGMLFIAGCRKKFFFMILIPAILAVPVLILIEPYRLNRLSAFLNPWANPQGEGYQLIQSLYALGSGGWFGVGLFNSRQKFKFLPFAESDFILSVIGEELGLIGVILLFVVLGYIVFFGVKTASHANNLFSFLLAGGITIIFAVQVVINALVVTGSIPPTGLPLPLISAGNTSLIVYMSAFGLLANIRRTGCNLN